MGHPAAFPSLPHRLERVQRVSGERMECRGWVGCSSSRGWREDQEMDTLEDAPRHTSTMQRTGATRRNSPLLKRIPGENARIVLSGIQDWGDRLPRPSLASRGGKGGKKRRERLGRDASPHLAFDKNIHAFLGQPTPCQERRCHFPFFLPKSLTPALSPRIVLPGLAIPYFIGPTARFCTHRSCLGGQSFFCFSSRPLGGSGVRPR